VDTAKDAELSMLIGIKDRLYEHTASDMSLSEFSIPYCSVGSGSPFALGFMYASQSFDSPEKVIEGAVKSAIKFSPTCSGTIDILST
jgi:20S proteasome alpha/beta subunit